VGEEERGYEIFPTPSPPLAKSGENRDGRISELLPFPWLGAGRSGDRKPLLTTLGQGRGRAWKWEV